MRRILPESVLEEVGKLDPAAIAQVQAEAWPDVRDADELHDVLHTLIALPEALPARCGGGRLARPNRRRQSKFDRHAMKLAKLVELSSRAGPGIRDVREWQGYFERLIGQGRAVRADHGGLSYWVAAERAKAFSLLFPGAAFDRPSRRN